jgi:hypothetical protein
MRQKNIHYLYTYVTLIWYMNSNGLAVQTCT